ncbi:hypothetical protein 2 [Beihai picorna-like virus 39]|uniref:hypothetical protein 2 n=1 Tax=Beihai picorna-like virus 39 TaxID=1922582 RepID=UPI000909E7E3|nr:hypothetical protein 2 [Beihai picorna-like virus 39]APG76872.1 hypothetical protein 2 [Beihai picorna-like virus 39]
MLSPQSGMFCSTESPGTQELHQTVEFIDQNPSFECKINSEIDPSRSSTRDGNAEFSNFFSRPVMIHSTRWNVNSELDQLIDPWQLWFSNPRISNRLNNFHLFKGKMKIKVVINGNQFYWGRSLLSYLPFSTQGNFTTENTWLDKLPASQRPHLWIDPSTSQGGTMELPFYFPRDAVDLTLQSEMQDIGKLWLLSTSPLHHPTSSNAVAISIFAWVEDIELSAPTHISTGLLQPQSGKMESIPEEQSSGKISGPLTTVAKASDVLSEVPVMAPYAKMASATARGLGAMASLFGYSRPRLNEAPRPYKAHNVSNVANTDTSDNSTVLALTSNQDLSISPRTAGLGDSDELTIKSIAGKESLFITPEWRKTDNQDDVLFSMPVTPQLYRRDRKIIPVTNDGWAHTPMSYCALPFGYWRGTINFRFQIVASGYHKGRLLIVHDPVSSADYPETNIVRSRIVDIAEERDFTVKVGWTKNFSYQEVRTPDENEPFAIGGAFNARRYQDNGVLTVYVLNELVSSSADSDPVYINVIVSAEDLELAGPDNSHIATKTFLPTPLEFAAKKEEKELEPQAGVISSDMNTTPSQNIPEDPPSISMIGTPSPEDNLASIYFGERVASFRSLIKRYCYQDTFGRKFSTNDNSVVRLRHARAPRPIFRGYLDDGIHVDPDTVDTQVNGVPTTILAYAMAPFHGWRGNLRYKFVPCQSVAERPGRVTITRQRVTTGYSLAESGEYDISSDNLNFIGVEDSSSWGGAMVTTPENSNVLEIEWPWYSNERFASVVMRNVRGSARNGLVLSALTFLEGNTTRDYYTGFDAWIAAGDNFNVFFFCGIPPMWEFSLEPVVVPPTNQ